MQNLMKKSMLSNSSEFSMELELGKNANLEVLGYGIRLTKNGKLKFPKLSTGNLSDSDITKVKDRCIEDDKPFSGKGGMVYQVTAYKNIDTAHEFINSFNPNVEADTLIEVSCFQRKDTAGALLTYTGTDGTVYPSIAIKLVVKESDEVKNAKLGVEAES